MSDPGRFLLPPERRTGAGAERRVGFELEFAGLTLEAAARAAANSLGAEARAESAAKFLLDADDLGEFVVELDWDYLKRKAAESGVDDQGVADDRLVELLKSAAEVVVPVEVVCPPIPLSRLDALASMVTALREAGAVGTGDSVLAAFGVHINAEAPSLEADSLYRHAAAFALLQWWLVTANEVDITRRLTPYIDLYPRAYVDALLADSRPTVESLIDVYLEHNPTRNRALDLLPIFSEIDPERVARAVDDPRIQARPAYHYRLPNCHIEKPNWSLAESWNLWCMVERVAADRDDLDILADAWRERVRPLVGVARDDWVEFVERWLEDRASA